MSMARSIAMDGTAVLYAHFDESPNGTADKGARSVA
jgi:hypothetical protein